MYKVAADEMPPGSAFPDIIKAVNTKWKELPREGKKKYENAALIDREQSSVGELVSRVSPSCFIQDFAQVLCVKCLTFQSFDRLD